MAPVVDSSVQWAAGEIGRPGLISAAELAFAIGVVVPLILLLFAGFVLGCACCSSDDAPTPVDRHQQQLPTVSSADPRYQTLLEADNNFVPSIKKPKRHGSNQKGDRHGARPGRHMENPSPNAKELQKEKEREAAIAEVKRLMELEKAKMDVDSDRRREEKEQHERDKQWRLKHRQMWGRKHRPPSRDQKRHGEPTADAQFEVKCEMRGKGEVKCELIDRTSAATRPASQVITDTPKLASTDASHSKASTASSEPSTEPAGKAGTIRSVLPIAAAPVQSVKQQTVQQESVKQQTAKQKIVKQPVVVQSRIM